MKNNQENVQNQVNNVEQNVNSTNGNANKPQNSGKGKTIALIIIVLILVLVLGVCGGLLISEKGDTVRNNIRDNNEKSTNKETNKESENKEEKTTNKETNKESEGKEEKSNDSKEYSQQELEKMALDYYEAKTGYRPGHVASMVNSDGTISIQLYDDMGEHNSTSDWYTVDPKTAIGTDIMENKIDLKVKPIKEISGSDNNSNNVSTSESSTETIWYTCDAFKIKLPKSWENKYKVDIGDIGVDVGGGDSYNFRSVSDNEYLFSIQLRNNEIKDDSMPYKFLGNYSEGNNVIYVYMTERTDLPKNAELYTSMMKDFETNKDDVYIKQKFGDKTFYAKDFLKIEKGSMYKYYRYYIDENDRLCILNYENDVTIEIIADQTDNLTYNADENVIHAYPIGKSFMNNISRNVEEIVFENIN